MRKARVWAWMMALAFAACTVGTGIEEKPVEVATDRVSYRLGQAGILSVHNQTFHPISVPRALCGVVIERQMAGEWEQAGNLGLLADGSTACILQSVRVSPGRTLAESFTLDTRFELPAEYRFVLVTERGVTTSNTFTVEE